MTQTENERLELAPNLAAFEARLSQQTPSVSQSRLETVKAGMLLRLCQRKLREGNPLDGPLLAETIVKSGDERISLSLRQYVRQVKIAAICAGFLAGFLCGAAALAVLAVVLTRPVNMADDHRSNPTDAPPSLREGTVRPPEGWMNDNIYPR